MTVFEITYNNKYFYIRVDIFFKNNKLVLEIKHVIIKLENKQNFPPSQFYREISEHDYEQADVIKCSIYETGEYDFLDFDIKDVLKNFLKPTNEIDFL